MIFCLEGNSSPSQKRPQIILFQLLHHLHFGHENTSQTFLHISSYKKEQNWQDLSCGASPCGRSNSLASSQRQVEVLLRITAHLQEDSSW